MKDFKGFLNSPQFNEAEEFGYYSLSVMSLILIIIFLFMEDVIEGWLPVVIALVTLLANVKYSLFMFWEYYNENGRDK